MHSHLLLLVIFAFFVSLVFAVIAKDDAREQLRFGSMLFAGFVVLVVSGIFGHSLYRRTWYLYAGLGLALWRILQDPHIVQVALPLDAPKGREETSAGGP